MNNFCPRESLPSDPSNLHLKEALAQFVSYFFNMHEELDFQLQYVDEFVQFWEIQFNSIVRVYLLYQS